MYDDMIIRRLGMKFSIAWNGVGFEFSTKR